MANLLERDQERQGRPIGGQTLEFQWIRNGVRLKQGLGFVVQSRVLLSTDRFHHPR